MSTDSSFHFFYLFVFFFIYENYILPNAKNTRSINAHDLLMQYHWSLEYTTFIINLFTGYEDDFYFHQDHNYIFYINSCCWGEQ